MTAIVSFLRALRARAIGNSLRVTTSSIVPPKLIFAIVSSLSCQRGAYRNVELQAVKWKGVGQIRNPKAETRKKPEVRSPKRGVIFSAARPSRFGSVQQHR